MHYRTYVRFLPLSNAYISRTFVLCQYFLKKKSKKLLDINRQWVQKPLFLSIKRQQFNLMNIIVKFHCRFCIFYQKCFNFSLDKLVNFYYNVHTLKTEPQPFWVTCPPIVCYRQRGKRVGVTPALFSLYIRLSIKLLKHAKI